MRCSSYILIRRTICSVIAFSAILPLVTHAHAQDGKQQAADHDKGKCQLVVKLSGIEGAEGHLHVALYDKEKSWKTDMKKELSTKQYRLERVLATKVQDGKLEVVFDEIRSGKYAVSLFHDLNDNEKIDKAGLLPIEAFGFSNNYKPVLRPPRFRECAFNVKEAGKTEIGIQLLGSRDP